MAKVLKFTACAAAVGVALYAAAGYVGVPYAVRSVIEKNASEMLGRSVTLEGVSFNPWTWVFELRGLTVPEEGSDPLLRLDLLRVDASSQTLFKMAPVLNEITVDGLKVNAVVNDKNRRELERLLGSGDAAGKGGADAQKKAAPADSGLPKFALSNISVTNSSLRYSDAKQGVNESLTDITLKLPFVSTMEGASESLVTPALSMKLNGSQIVADGSTKPFGSTLEARLNLRVNRLDAARLARILPQMRSNALTVAGANLSSDLTFVFRNPTGGNPAKMLLSGSASLDGVSVTQSGKPIVTVPKAAVTLKEIDLAGRSASVESVTVTGLDVRAVNSKSGLNLLRAADAASGGKSSGAAASPGASAASGASGGWSWSVGSARLVDGRVSWTDSTVAPAANVTARNIDATVKNLSSAKGSKADFSLSLETLGGTLSTSGKAGLSPLAVTASAKGTNLKTAQVASYIRSALGADLSASTSFSVKADYAGDDVKASGTVSASGFSLRSGKSTLASFSSATVRLDEFSTKSRTAKVGLVSVASPQVNAVNTKAGLNFSRLGGGGAKAAKTDAAQAPAKPAAVDAAWNWSLAEARVTDGTLRWRDETVSPVAVAELPKLNVTVKNVSPKPGAKGTLDVSSAPGGGSLKASGGFTLSPLSADVKVNGSRIGLKPFSQLMLGYAGIGAKSGDLDASGAVTLKPGKQDKTVGGWKGDVSLASLQLVNAKGGSLMSWSKASLTGMDVETTDPIRLVIAKAEIDQPAQKKAQQIKQAAGLASLLTSIMGDEKTTQRIEKASEKIPTKISLKDIRYENGKFSAAGVSAASIEAAMLQLLTNAMSPKLSGSSAKAATAAEAPAAATK